MPVIEKELLIEAPVSVVYDFWQDFARFADFLPAVKRIEVREAHKSYWEVKAPFNTTVQFVAETKEQRRNEYLLWESVHGAGTEEVESGGEIFFEAPSPTTTRVRLRFHYTIPSTNAQRVIDTLAALGYPKRDFEKNLAEIKRRIEGMGASSGQA
ncbi:MAG: SRPBCC family protein [Bacteroidota bacterium]